MEKEINIAEILKNVPIGTKLYSPLFGDVFIKYIGEIFITVRHHSTTANFYHNGRLYDYEETEPMLFPSKEIRDWSKVTWKKGDVLSCGVDNLCIFEKWANKEYTEFYAKFVTPNYSGNTFKTEKWSKETNEAVIKQYISNIEEFKGGKLNLTTLEIEKQPEFKDGDILSCDEDTYTKHTTLILHKNGCVVESLVSLIRHHDLVESREPINEVLLSRLYYAREDEKKELFDTLSKKGKRWDAEKKIVVDLKPKVELKPFDKVLCRNSKDDTWEADFFARLTRKEIDYTQSGKYLCVGDLWMYCIPYNEDTKHLLGTTDEWKGGEG